MGWGLEQEIDNNGIPDSANVLLTRYGIIWANNYGCFMYGGQAPVELSQRIGSVEWRSHLSRNYEVLPIGFHEKQINYLLLSKVAFIKLILAMLGFITLQLMVGQKGKMNFIA